MAERKMKRLAASLAVTFWVAALAVLAVGFCSARAMAALALDLAAVAEGRVMETTELGALAQGGRQVFSFSLDEPVALDLRVPLEAAPFNGTQLNAQVNGRRLLPYFAFGGDTRYDAVRDRPGMRPPVVQIEGRWLLPPSLLRRGRNELILWTTGITPDPVLEKLGPALEIRIDRILISRAEGHALPHYANTIYYDFNIWPQGYPWPSTSNYMHYLALVGILNGKGMPNIIPNLGGTTQQLWAVKRQCESYALDWGVGRQEFYTIWEFCGKPQLWARYVDVDNNPETQSAFHNQTIFPHVLQNDPAAKGADVVLYDVERYTATLEPAIRELAPYTNFYNFKCEQHGARGAGFGPLGDAFEAYGMTGHDWASNHWEANKAARDLVLKYNPDGLVQEMNFWMPDVRHYLYDGALKRNQPMNQIIDILMTHFGRTSFYDYTPEGRLTHEIFRPQRQYPGGQFEHSVRLYRGFWQALYNVAYPETAIDFNRYRLGRTQDDMVLADPAIHHWNDGRPFDYRAGFDGDEHMYNSENGIYIGYSATAPYQYLHGNFAYSLLPTGSSEPRDLKVTERLSLTETRDAPVNLYGQWVEGVAHTKRLRTVDPLYGDLFGWTGQEYCNSGDYIKMTGTRDPHHRIQPFDANALVRRICYAFVTTGPIVPAYLNPGHDDSLFVKALLQVFDGKTYFGLYAANFDQRPHKLDVTVPLSFPRGTEALVYDDRAWDWDRSVEVLRIAGSSEFRYRATVGPLGAWLVLIPASPSVLAHALHLPPTPAPIYLVSDAHVTQHGVLLRWEVPDTSAAVRSDKFIVQVAREAVFRSQDIVYESEPLAATQAKVMEGLEPGSRYFWRIRAVDSKGRSGIWSRPASFIYQWPEYAAIYAPKDTPAKPSTDEAASVPPEWRRLADERNLEQRTNLAWQGEILGTGGYMRSPSRAVDGQAASFWTNDLRDQTHPIPAEWCVIWPEPVRIRRISILWLEARTPKTFAIQVSNDAAEWRTLYASDEGASLLTEARASARARYFRVAITEASVTSGEVGIRELIIE